MLKVLVPIDGSPNCRIAVHHVIKQFTYNSAMEIHLVNVQLPFNGHISRFLNRRTLQNHHREESEKALRPVRQMLDGFGIPYSVHTLVGDRARLITSEARRLHCDQIIMSTARKDSLTRLVEDSVTNKVLALASMPVEVISGTAVSKWERYGIPAAVGTLLALLLVAAAD